MAQLDSKSLETLRQSLSPLAALEAPSQGIRDFCRFYDIDPENRRAGVIHRVGTIQSGPYNLAVHRWNLEGATRSLLIVHGYTDHVGLFGHLVDYGLEQGCNVIAFDLPGHGLSTGEPVAIDDFSHYSLAINSVMEANSDLQLPWWVLAQSTGCSALIDYARIYDWPFTHAVFLAPLIRPARWLWAQAGYLLLYKFKEGIPRKFAENSGDAEFLASVKRDPLQARQISIAWLGALRRWLAGLEFKSLGVGPLLVVQGDGDTTVAWRYNMKKIVKLFPGCQIEYLSGAGHQLANETEHIRKLYLDKVDRFVGFN